MQWIEILVIILAVIILIVYFIFLCFDQYVKRLSETLATQQRDRDLDDCLT